MTSTGCLILRFTYSFKTSFSSLYPFVNKNCVYPVGHPIILLPPQIDLSNIRQYFGIIKCQIVPPINLLHPVLPARYHKKLMFVLCHSCATSPPNDGVCYHTLDSERALTGSWVTEEVFTALDKGYRLTDVFEIWHFPQKSDSLFRNYINMFLAMKQEARGLPDDLQDESAPGYQERMQAYVDEFEQAEGVRMVPARMSKRKNIGLYQTAKLCLNSFWGKFFYSSFLHCLVYHTIVAGKFGQRPNKSQIEFCHQEHEFWRLICDERLSIRAVHFHDEEYAQLEYTENRDFVLPGINTNIVIAAFTTCYARLHLYQALDRLGKDVLYYDTGKIEAIKWTAVTQLELNYYTFKDVLYI